MRQLIAMTLCSAGMLMFGTQQSEAGFFGHYPGYYQQRSCCYGPSYYGANYGVGYYGSRISYYGSRTSYYGSSNCCPTTSCYQPPAQTYCPSTCAPACSTGSCGSGCATGGCGVGGCATQPSPYTAAAVAVPQRSHKLVKTYTRARMVTRVRTAELVSTDKPAQTWKPLARRATLRTVSLKKESPSNGWEAIN